MKLEGKNMIGNFASAKGSTFFQAINPVSTQKLAPHFYEATSQEIDAAIQKSHQAFQVYRNVSGKKKASFLITIAEEIMALGDDLIQRCTEETGLTEARLLNERQRVINHLKMFASLLEEGSWVDARIDLAQPDRKPLPKPDIRSMQKPLGPVGVFGASNFPLAYSVAGGDTVSALAAGCTVVIKAHPAHPGTCELVGRAVLNAVEKSNLPDGVFSMVHGESPDVGLALVRHPLIKAIGFTGSFRGGKALFDEANNRPSPIPVYAEMGSTNPVFILPGVLQQKRDVLAHDLAASVTLGVGQFCTNPGLVFLQSSQDGKEFTATLSKHIEETTPGVMLTQTIQRNFQKGMDRLTGSADVKTIARGKQGRSGFIGVANLFQSTVKSFLSDHLLEEEVFGPSTLLITANTKDELIQAAEKLGGHLTATVHGTEEDFNTYRDLISILEQKAGRLIINGYPTGVEVCDSIVHGGPFPATTDSRTTSVGTLAITRFTRPVCYQNFPASLLPAELQNTNRLQLWRLVNGERTKDNAQ